MAFTCGFYNAVDHDRVYSSEDFGHMFDGLITDGIYPSIGHCFAVLSGNGVGVRVRSGRAWFNLSWSYNSSDFPIQLTAPDLLLPRIDAIVLEVDRRLSGRDNSLKAITGTPAVNPVKPALQNGDGLYQYPLAYVTVAPNAYEITNSDIENAVGHETPFTAGILESISIEELWAQWKDQFYTWLYKLKVALSEDAAGNLLGMIELLDEHTVKKSELATVSEAQAGTLNNKWMSALRVQNHFDAHVATDAQVTVAADVNRYLKPSHLPKIPASIIMGILGTKFKSITLTSGTSWTPPSDAVGKPVYVTLIGGGGGGAGGSGGTGINTYEGYTGRGGAGGGAGQTVCFMFIPTAAAISYTIGDGGAGGAGGAYVSSMSDNVDVIMEAKGKPGFDGRKTTFAGISAGGGYGGVAGFFFTPNQGATSNKLLGGVAGGTNDFSNPYMSGYIITFQSSTSSAAESNYRLDGDGIEGSLGSSAALSTTKASVGQMTSGMFAGNGCGGGGGGGSYRSAGGNGGNGTTQSTASTAGSNGSYGSGGGGGGGGLYEANTNATNGGNGSKGGNGGNGCIIIQYQGN